MFTGMIEELGEIKRITRKGSSAEVEVSCTVIMQDVKLGDSIAVNGVCLTVTAFNAKGFIADASEETLRRTSLKVASPGHIVNLERALQMGGRFGGHIVQGHVDGIGNVLSRTRQGDFWVITVEVPESIRMYVAEKGSVAIDGISLTVAEDLGHAVTIAVIPHTFTHTNLSNLKPSGCVNIEVDVLARYTHKLLNFDRHKEKLEKLLFELE